MPSVEISSYSSGASRRIRGRPGSPKEHRERGTHTVWDATEKGWKARKRQLEGKMGIKITCFFVDKSTLGYTEAYKGL